MALEAPGHAVRFGVIDNAHVIYVAVTTKAADAAIHVASDCKKVIGRAMKLHPLDRLAGFPTLANGLELGIVLLHLRMAIHAGLRVW